MDNKWVYFRTRKRCPVCRVHKTYEGVICTTCLKIGYKVQLNGKIKREIKE